MCNALVTGALSEPVALEQHVVHLGEDDVIIITCDQILSDSQVAHFKDTLKHAFPNNEVVVFGKGISFSAVSKEQYHDNKNNVESGDT